MSVNPRAFRNMSAEQRARYQRRVIGLHRGLVLANAIGMVAVCVTGIVMIVRHMT